MFSAVEKGHMSPSTMEMIRDIDEAKQARDMNDVLDNLGRSDDKADMMKKLREGKSMINDSEQTNKHLDRFTLRKEHNDNNKNKKKQKNVVTIIIIIVLILFYRKIYYN